VNAGPDSAGGLAVQRPLNLFTDDLEHVLKPMGARVFRVAKPEEFRKALGAILDEIAKMQVSR
jgi:thiamine pyrophosphate-dependent acetolactate synthase large subunit-like protein